MSSSNQVIAPSAGQFTLTFVGTGASTAVPVLGHINRSCACADALKHWDGKNVRNNVSLLITLPIKPSTNKEQSAISKVANKEVENQSNTSKFSGEDEQIEHNNFALAEVNYLHGMPVKHILVDAGKTFRDAYFRVLMKNKVQLLDALLLTHDHADAIAGLDDLRDLQKMKMNLDDGHWYILSYIPTYMTHPTLHTLTNKVQYIMKNSQIVGDAATCKRAHLEQIQTYYNEKKGEAEQRHEAVNDIGIRRTAALQVFTLPTSKPVRFHISGLEHIMYKYNEDDKTKERKTNSSTSEKSNDDEELHLEEEEEFPFYSLPVEHGKNYISLGFVFGRGVAFRSAHASEESVADKSCVVYISDVSTIIEPSMSFLHDLVKIDVLIIDCLHRSGKQSSIHFCMDDVIKLVITLKPKQVYTVGMFCDIEQYKGEEELRILLHDALAKCNDYLATNNVGGIHVAYDGLQLVLPL